MSHIESQPRHEPTLSGTYLVTGGTRGIGRAVSIQLARAGACVIANYVRNEDSASALKAWAERERYSVHLCRADVSIPKGLRQIEAEVESIGLPLSGLLHCAATGTHRPVTALTGRHLDWTFAVNARAFFELVTLLLPKFGKNASVVALSSAGAMRAVPHYTVVGASKGALESLARHLAVELAPRGIRVNVLAPGPVATEAWQAIPNGEALLVEAASRSPLRRLVTPDEVAMVAHFLCSPAASGVNGHTLTVDGGAGIAAWG